MDLPKQKVPDNIPISTTDSYFLEEDEVLEKRGISVVAFEALIIGLGSEDHKSFSPTATIQICPLLYILTQLNKQNMEVRVGHV